MKRLFIIALCLFMAGPVMAAGDVPSTIRAAISNYHPSVPGLATSGAVSPEALAELAKSGFTTIVDLRTPPEGTKQEHMLAGTLGLSYTNIPVSDAEGISQEQIDAFAQIYESADGPVLLHCASGNRAGALWAAYRLHKGVPAETAIAEGRAAGMKPAFEEQVKSFCTSC